MYLYHGIPETVRGNELLPLSDLQEAYPDLYTEYMQKYTGREEILARKVRLIDCTWADVIQLLPLHPGKLFALQKELGLIDEVPDYTYFCIDPSLLDPETAIVYFKSVPGDENATEKWLHDVNLADLQEVPDATRQYYENLVSSKQPVFNYQFVPHVVYRGRITIADAPVVGLRS